MSAKDKALSSQLALDEQAARYFIKLLHAPSTKERDSIRQWIAGDPRHAVAFARAEAAWDMTGSLKGFFPPDGD